MMTKQLLTISLLLMYAHIMKTTTSNSTENSSLMTSVSTMSSQVITSLSSATTTQLGDDLNLVIKSSEMISTTTWQGNTSSSPYINTTAKTVAGGSTALKPIFNIRFLGLCSTLTLLCILRRK